MLVQHDVSGERLYQPNEVWRHGRHQRVAVVSIPCHPSNVVDHLVQTVFDSADGSQQLLARRRMLFCCSVVAPFADMKGAEIALYFDTTDSTSHTSFAALTHGWLSILTP